MYGMRRALTAAAGRFVKNTQKRSFGANYDNYGRHGAGPKQYGNAPYFLGYWHHGVTRSILERSGWAIFFFIPIEAAWIFYDFGYRRVDTEMGPYISDNSRYDGTEYDEKEAEVRFRWATDGTLCQYPSEHAERQARENIATIAKLRLEMKAERGQI
eukprot:TRINITY_DN3008_c0_g1_i1.p2 TRINITY_DN3008_c0_g1~~TRINITY_DN3008_c0_g1_i1.p2  ORF type:complete len:171 (+),score=56.99 TRINITY_DN3008_c0_g1_i1:44-514(+)